MIKSRFSKAILPLAFTTAISGGMLVKTAVKPSPEKHEIKTEQPAKTNPLENPAVLGTIFSLGLLGTAGAATLGKAVDIRYREAHEKLEEIYDMSTLTEDDYKEAFDAACKELDSKGEKYDKEALKAQYTPKPKEDIIKMIDENKTHIRRVTENCNQDKRAAIELAYLEEELKSAVKYGKMPESDNIKYQMLYRFDKATLPKKDWKTVEEKYKSEHPDIDFDKKIGIKHESRLSHYTKAAIENYMSNKNIVVTNPDNLLKPLKEIKENISTYPEMFNNYDREELTKLTDKAIIMLTKGKELPEKLYNQIMDIYIFNQQTY